MLDHMIRARGRLNKPALIHVPHLQILNVFCQNRDILPDVEGQRCRG